MLVTINKMALFKLLQSKNYTIGKNLIAATKSLIEINSNRTLNDFSKDRLNEFSSEFVSLKNKWNRLRGGEKRSIFLQKNLRENVILEMKESEFLEKNETLIDTKIDTTIDTTIETTNERISSNVNYPKSSQKINKSSIRKRKKAIVKDLSKFNDNILRKYNLCFKQVNLSNLKKHDNKKAFEVVYN